ncbi:hypothetical protein EVAR_15040_1 [Eumeta japonica]|uniref:Uncharacterized protein n=1 Tax=Eumeta variegata TaxID=151549 RepID=A0A4C1X9X9_EUMVA|nr:hypothetical protein EVAR_15040_1 [Eumeta japonica]
MLTARKLNVTTGRLDSKAITLFNPSKEGNITKEMRSLEMKYWLSTRARQPHRDVVMYCFELRTANVDYIGCGPTYTSECGTGVKRA